MFRKTITEAEADTREKLIIDIRSKEEFEKETYPGAIHIEADRLEQSYSELSKEHPIYLMCQIGQKSDDMAETLSAEGWECYSIIGGFQTYLRDQLTAFLQKEEEVEVRAKEAERSIVKKFRKETWRKFTKAIN